MVFLGELLINLPLPIDSPVEEQCGKCVACMTTCPTGAIVEPYTIDARRCISYLTIELEGAIPEEFRPLMGNRIYGCDDCQLICPWNRFSSLTEEDDFLRAVPYIHQNCWIYSNGVKKNFCVLQKVHRSDELAIYVG